MLEKLYVDSQLKRELNCEFHQYNMFRIYHNKTQVCDLVSMKIREKSFQLSICCAHDPFDVIEVEVCLFIFLRFNGLLGPLIFTIVNLKSRLATTSIVPYDMDSCPFMLIIAILQEMCFQTF